MLEKFSVKKPFTVVVGVIMILVLGLVSFMNTSTDLLPEMELPMAIVVTPHIGATPEQVEREVSIPIEGAMSTLSGIDTVSSVSSEHVSMVMLQFVESISMDSAALEMREALDMVELPDGVGRPMTLRLNPDMMPVMSASLYMEGTELDELSELALSTLAPALEAVPGVAVVNLSGTVQNQLHVILREENLARVNSQLGEALVALMSAFPMDETADMEAAEPFGLPEELIAVDTIVGLLSAQNFSMPAGMTVEGNVDYMVRVGEDFESLDDIRNLMIFDPAQMGLVGMEPIRLSDVADIFETDDSHLSFSRVNGNPSIMLTIQRQSEFSVSDVTGAVRERMDDLSDEHDGLGFAILMDQGEMIGEVIDNMLGNLVSGGLLSILVLLLFLRDIKPTVIIAASIPISLMLAFTLMYFTGITLNMISMGGLALAVGMLVDNSIVVIENIYRIRSTTDLSPAKAAIKGASQVVGSVFASSLTTIAVFFPIVFTGGITRQLFQDLALTIAYSLMASLIIALTVVPAGSSVLLKRIKHTEDGKGFNKFVDGYEKSLRLALKFKWPVLAFAGAALVFSFWAITQRGMELFPAMDSPQISVNAELPTDTPFENVVAIAEDFSELVQLIPDVETVGVSIGGDSMMAMLGMGGLGGNAGTNISMYVLLEEGRTASSQDIIDEINVISARLDIEASASSDDAGMGIMMGDPISLRVEGRDLDTIRDTAIALSELVSTVDGAINVTDLLVEGAPELRVIVDPDAAMSRGLTVAQVFMAVNGALTQPERSLNLNFQGRNYEILIQDGDFSLPGRNELADLQLPTEAGLIPLSEVAEIREDLGFSSINRQNGIRHITINGEIADGYNVGLVNDEIARRLEDFEALPGTTVVVGGEAEAIADAMGDLVLMLGMAVLFIYLIMVAQFQSLKSPFIIMFSIPLAFTGAFLILLVTHTPLSIVAMIGLILLTGVIVNNGIVYVDFVNQMRWAGTDKRTALVNAGRQRIRPILMTALTTIVSMSFVALGIGEGTEMMQPMALVTIGGLIYGDFMILYVVPIIYDLFNKNKDVTKEDLEEIM